MLRRSLFFLVFCLVAGGLPGRPARAAAQEPVLSENVTQLQLSGGGAINCAVVKGAARCWGEGGYAGIGMDSSVMWRVPWPAAVVGLSSGVKQVAGGSEFGCALLDNGTVRCWGRGSAGQLGNGATADSLVPVQVSGLTGVYELASGVGGGHMCALVTGGALKCWGRNSSGQLGNGTQTNALVPVTITSLPAPISKISVGAFNTCAIAAGGAWCWGANTKGQLGNGTTTSSSVPVQVSGLDTDVAHIAVGGRLACALTSGGAAKCWGDNEFGQLGNGTTTDSLVPVQVSGLTSGVVALRVGFRHGCVITHPGGDVRNRSVACWGMNSANQIGSNDEYNTTPYAVPGTQAASAIALGDFYSCAVINGSVPRCWGNNYLGQLGVGWDSGSVAAPTELVGLRPSVLALDLGASHTCVTLSNTLNRCWGNGLSHQIGTGSAGIYPTPASPFELPAAGKSIAGGSGHSCLVGVDRHIRCWGDNSFGQVGAGSTAPVIPTQTQVFAVMDRNGKQIDANANSTCAVRHDGVVFCWGLNSSGELGLGDTANRHEPHEVSGLGGPATSIASGGNHNCALLANGTVKCWGKNTDGQLGIGTTANALSPQTVIGLSGVVGLAAGGNHTCAQMSDGTMKCWGKNADGQLGIGTTANALLPQTVTGLAGGVKALGLGASHSCAVLATGALQCWGRNTGGQLGTGTTTGATTPQTVTGLAAVELVSGGNNHTCAALFNAELRCWGNNASGQLGTGTTANSLVPVAVLPIVP